MKTRSIRFRLTIWYSVALLIVTALIFVSFYFVTKRTLLKNTDDTLVSHTNKVIEVITKQEGDMHLQIEKQGFLSEFSAIPGMFVVAIDRNGQIVSSSLTNESAKEKFLDLYNTAKITNNAFFQNQTINDSYVRFYVAPIKYNDVIPGFVLVGHSIDIIQKSLDSLLAALAIVFVVLAIPTSIGGYIIASRALQPISTMSKKLKKISSENLNERVDNPKTGDEIEELALTFNDLLSHLTDAFTRERQFIADVAHELKTPLSTLRSSLEISLNNRRPNLEYRRIIKDAIIETNSIASTLKNILDLAWSETPVEKKSAYSFDLTKLMEELIETAEKMGYSRKISVESSFEKDVNILGFKDKIARAIINVIDNAIKYAPNGGKIYLTLEKKNGNSKISIKDSGVGIEKEDIPHIFDRFYRGSKTAKILGSGLGLAISQSIIISHYGKIKVDSKVNSGSTFTITIPLSYS